MTEAPPFLVEWWATRLYYEREAREIAHQEHMVSPELMAMYNRPQSVIDLQKMHDQVLHLMGVK